MEKAKRGRIVNWKNIIPFLAGLFLMVAFMLMPQTEAQAATKNGVAKATDGNWYYYVNDQVQTAYDGLAKYSGNWWYFEDGKLNFGYTGLCKYNGSWWYVQNGKVNFSATTLCKYNGSWWYVSGGKVNFGATGLCKYNGSWWYVQNGKVNFSATTLCKYNGTWFYVSRGKVNFGATGLCKYNGSWWYVQNGKVNFSATTLCKYNGSWWYVSGGKVNFNYVGYVKYNGSNWYVSGGKMVRQAGYTGMKKNSSGTWLYYVDGKVQTNYTGMAQNDYGWWYFQNGKLNLSYTGMAQNAYGWWYFSKGQLATNFTGVVKNSIGYWYFEKGKINFEANKRITFNGATFDTENGRAYVVGKNAKGYYNMPEDNYQRKYEVAYRTGNTSGMSAEDKKIVAGMAEFLQYAEQYKTLYEKEKAIHDYMVSKCCYDMVAYDGYMSGDSYVKGFTPYSMEGIFVYKTAVCDGYSKAFKMCMDILGIPCVRISGTANGGGHAWNAVQLEGEWYLVDVTWDDPIPDSPGRIRYSYFNITDAKMREDHSYSWQYSATATKYRYGRVEYEQLKNQESYFTNQADFAAYINKKLQAGETQIQCYLDKSMGDKVNLEGVGGVYQDKDTVINGGVKNMISVSYTMETNEWYSTYYFEFEFEAYQQGA